MAYKKTETACVPKVGKNITYPKHFTRHEKEFARKVINMLSDSSLGSELDLGLIFRYTYIHFQLEKVECILHDCMDLKKIKELNAYYTSLNTIYIKLSKELQLSPTSTRNKQKLKSMASKTANDDDEELKELLKELE